MYELGTSSACTDERTGAASLWMVPTWRTGEAAARAGSKERVEYLMMALTRTARCDDKEKRGNGDRKRRMRKDGMEMGMERI